MNKHLLNIISITTLTVLLGFSQLVSAETPARAQFFDGRVLNTSNLQDVELRLPSLYDPATGKRSTLEDFKKPIVIRKEIDGNSSLIEAAFYGGEVIKEVTVEIEIPSVDNKDNKSYLVINMRNLVVTSVSTGGSDSSDIPVEEVSLNYEEVKWTYLSTSIFGFKK